MCRQAVAALSLTLRGHVDLGKSRVETLRMIVVGMVGARAVNLGHVATETGSGVPVASTCRRLQRFVRAMWIPGRTGRRGLSRGRSGLRAHGRSRRTGPTGGSGRAT